MSNLAFDFEWTDPLGARGAELRATWARLSVIVDGTCITRVFDHESRTVRDAVYVPLYPLAEWLATRWWNLQYEVPSTDRLQDAEYQARHSLRFARDGFAMPGAALDTFGDVIQFRWCRETMPNHRLEFIEEGVARIRLEDFRQSVRAFIGAVITRLVEEKVTDSLLQQEWSANLDADDQEREFCAAAAALGLDPFAVDEATATSIVGAAQIVPESIHREFFDVAAPASLGEEAANLARTFEQAKQNDAELRAIVMLRDELHSGATLEDWETAERITRKLTNSSNRGSGTPWERGYSAARRVREVLNLGGRSLQSFAEIANALDVSIGSLESALIGEPAKPAPYEALVATNRRSSPSFTVARDRDDAAHRFRFCRGLYEFLYHQGRGPWLVTRAQSDRQKCSRAFAAELLAPAAAIRERVSRPGIASDDVDELAAIFGVSSFVIQHQLENHRIAKIIES